MARYYRRRYTRVVKPKKKWASNLINVGGATPQGYVPGTSVLVQNRLVVNSVETAAPTPVIVKAGNFKLQVDIGYNVNASTTVESKCFVMFIPDGLDAIVPDQVEEFVTKHPEWIIAWKYAAFDPVSSGTPFGSQTISFSSRLKRNLNSNDKIMFYCIIKSASQTANITSFGVGGMAQFWTCAN